MSKEEKTIYDLELHEVLSISETTLYATRVPNGWIYHEWNEETQMMENCTFVPYHEEFNNPEEKTYGSPSRCKTQTNNKKNTRR